MWRQIVKAPDTLQCPRRFQEKGPPASSPGTDPPSMERVPPGRGGLPVLAFHLNQGTSANKALIINAFTEFTQCPSHTPVPSLEREKIDEATLFDATIILKPILASLTFFFFY